MKLGRIETTELFSGLGATTLAGALSGFTGATLGSDGLRPTVSGRSDF